jgi:hypothetical protein
MGGGSAEECGMRRHSGGRGSAFPRCARYLCGLDAVKGRRAGFQWNTAAASALSITIKSLSWQVRGAGAQQPPVDLVHQVAILALDPYRHARRLGEVIENPRGLACESAWNKDPVFGLIGIQSGLLDADQGSRSDAD